MTTSTFCPRCGARNINGSAKCQRCGLLFPLIDDVRIGSMAATEQEQGIFPEKPDLRDQSPISQSFTVQDQPALAPTSTGKMPCFVKVYGGFMGCLLGLVGGLCLSLICIIPGVMASGNMVGNTNAFIEIAIALIVILSIACAVYGMVKGPYFLGKLLKSIGDTFRWMTRSQ